MAQLACGSSIKKVACMKSRSSHEKMDVAWQCISERLWKCLVGRYGGLSDRAYHAKGLYFGCTGEVCANSRGEKGQCTVPKRLEKYGWWKFQLLNTHISPKNSCTYYRQLSIQSGVSQRDKYPEEECIGVWLSLRILDSWYVSVL